MAIEITNNEERVQRRKIGESMAKFGSAMKQMADKTALQTKILSSMLSNQVREAYERKRQERLAAVEKDENDRSLPYRMIDNTKQFAGKISDKMGNFSDFAFGMLFKGAGIAAMAPIVMETAKNMVSVALKKMGASEEFAKAMSDGVSTSIGWGAIGMLFGKKFGVLFAGGSMLWQYLDKSLDISDKVESIFGKYVGDWSDSFTSAIGTVVSAGVLMTVPKLLTKGIGGAFSLVLGTIGDLATSLATTIAPYIKTGLMAALRAGGGAAMRLLPGGVAASIVSLYAAYGDDAANWISSQTGISHNWADTAVTNTSFAAAGASLGLMFGPAGAIVGGIVGLVAGLGYSVWKWFKRNEEEAKKKAEADMAETDKKIKGLDTSVNPATGLNDTLESHSRSHSVVNDTTKWSSDKALGETYTPMEIAVPAMDSKKSSDGNLASASVALDESIKQVMESFDGSDESKIKLSQTLHSLTTLKRDLDERTEENNGRVPPELVLMNNTLKRHGNRLIAFMRKNTPDILDTEFYDLPKFKKGTLGFQDFGTESVALLHGKEAVVPENTDAAVFLKKYFNKDWSSKFEKIASSRVSDIHTKIGANSIVNEGSKSSMIYAPTTIAPTTNMVGGSSVNNSRITSIGGFGNDLDFGLPKGAL